MIIENTTARLLVIPPSGGVTSGKTFDRIALKPGFNKVDGDAMAHALGFDDEEGSKPNKVVESWFDMGYLKMNDHYVEPPIPETLEGVNAKDSIAFIKRVSNPNKIREWLENDTRKSVRKALDEQLMLLVGGRHEPNLDDSED